MRPIASLTGPGLALLSLFASIRIASAQQPGAAASPLGIWQVCLVFGSDPQADRFRQPVYVSGVVPLQRLSEYEGMGRAFRRFVVNRFPQGMTSESKCAQAHSLTEAQGFTKLPGFVDCTRANCIMTGWTSMPESPAADTSSRPTAAVPRGPGSAVAVAAVPPKPTPPSPVAHPGRSAVAPARAAPQTPYAFCWGQMAARIPTAYLGAPFEAPARNIKAWTGAYREFLRNKYKFAGVVHCAALKSLADVQREADRVRAHRKAIETGWTYP